MIGSHWSNKCPHFWFRGSLVVAAEQVASSQSVHDPGLVSSELTSRLWISADLSVWWPLTKHKPSATSQSVTSDLARTRHNIYIMNNILDVAFITRSIVLLCKAKNDDPHACGSTLHWSTWDSRHSRCLVRLGSLVSKMCYSNMWDKQTEIRTNHPIPGRSQLQYFYSETNDQSPANNRTEPNQSAHHLPASENLENRSCKQLRWWWVWLFLLVQFLFSAQIMQNC